VAHLMQAEQGRLGGNAPRPTVEDLVATLRAEGLSTDAANAVSASRWSNGPGDQYVVHAHDYDKVLVAESGRITFSLPDQGTRAVVEPGRRLDLPAGTRHGAVVGSGGVACLELHLPRGSLEGLRNQPRPGGVAR
jgi:hypothetical protein